MNASTRKCTDTRPCNLMNCYGCRRRLIDDTTVRMLDAGVSQEAADQYRYNAINNLAYEIETPKPAKPKARKALTPGCGVNYQAIVDGLRTATSRSDARWMLVSATVAELNHLWTLSGRTDRIPSKLRKAERMEHLVEHLVGYRLDSEAIRTGAQN